jgi:FAD/FMN-containing dehydrogenase
VADSDVDATLMRAPPSGQDAAMQTILTPDAPAPAGHYSQAVVHGDLIYVGASRSPRAANSNSASVGNRFPAQRVYAHPAIAADAGVELPSQSPVLCIGIEGSAREAGWQVETLKIELIPIGARGMLTVSDADATKLWFALAEFQVPSDGPLTFKANLLPSRMVEFVNEAERAGCTVQAHAGSGIAHGHLPDTVSTAASAAEILIRLRGLARSARGNLIVVHCDKGWTTSFPLFGDPEPSWPLMRKLKHELDPQNLLNPHQFLAGQAFESG